MLAEWDFPEEALGWIWDGTDWEWCDFAVREYQHDIAVAAQRRDHERVRELQRRMTSDLDVRCEVVRRVAAARPKTGTDGERWVTGGQKMRAAIRLTPEFYEPGTQLHVQVNAPGGRKRVAHVLTWNDRAMELLWRLALEPVVESSSETKSFAFRPGRSTADAQSWVMDMLVGRDAPEYVVKADVRAYYSHIEHAWLMQRLPMDKDVLRKFLKRGIVRFGGFYEAEDAGISEGSGLSPLIANFMLDGLQGWIYHVLNGGQRPTDWANGNMVRFCDDVIVTARSFEDGRRVLAAIDEFLLARGLVLNVEKSKVVTIDQGFDFLSHTFVRKNGVVECRPSEVAVERIVSDVRDLVARWRRGSQRRLIKTLNAKLKGWAAYHKYGDARQAFRRVDDEVNVILLEALVQRHPRTSRARLLKRYFYKRADGEVVFACERDRSTALYKLSDTVLVRHRKPRVSGNRFLDQHYAERREKEQKIANVTGGFARIWRRQAGRCHYCGEPMLVDQARALVDDEGDETQDVTEGHYVHRGCMADDFEMVWLDVPVGASRFDVSEALRRLATDEELEAADAAGPKWKYRPLKRWFSRQGKETVILRFEEIEGIIKAPLPQTARKDATWWRRYSKASTIIRAWEDEGYEVSGVSLERESVTFERVYGGAGVAKLHPKLTGKRLPENLVAELDRFQEQLVKDYGL